MATALIIHAPEDALPARALAEKLRAAKLDVILEKPSGDEVREAVKSAQVVVALWSPRSVGQPAIADDVAFARGKSKLLHAQMQNTQTPAQFSGDKSVNLTGWRGEDEFAPWRELAKLVTDRAGVAPLPPPTPRPPSGFFTPGRVDAKAEAADAPRPPGAPASRAAAPRQAPPPPRPASPPPPPRQAAPQRAAPSYDQAADEPKRGGSMGIVLIIAALVVVLGAAAAGFMWWQGQQATQASSAALEQVDRNDPAALRALIAASSGAVKAQAQGALKELEERSYEAASDADTIEALQNFLHDFPDSEHALTAKGRIQELQQNPDTTTDTTAGDQPDNPEQTPPGAAATPGAPAAGGPPQLTPPGEPTTSQEPPSAPATTTTTP